jgi:Carboxypeptidase regulatory-like domain
MQILTLAKKFVSAFLFSCLICGALWAQVTAQISGTVKDASGAVLPGVEVTATQTATGLVRTVVSNETGSYILQDLPVGPYKLEAALAGFRTFVQTGIVLQVDANPVLNGWLNPAAFREPALGTYGNAGSRNIAGPGVIRFDMGITRTFAIRENQSLQFRAEAFNVSNHVNFCAAAINGIAPPLSCPDMNLNSPTFGKLLTANDPRIMQMALKYVF